MRLIVIGTGAFAAVLLVSGQSDYPLLCLVQVEGRSMEPTLHAGSEVLFGRLPWDTGDIILAEVGEGDLVIKRVAAKSDGQVLLKGDNRNVSVDYLAPERSVQAVLVCRTPLTSPLPREREPKPEDLSPIEYSLPQPRQPGWGMW